VNSISDEFIGNWPSRNLKTDHKQITPCNYKFQFYKITSQPGPGAARKKFDELTLHKVFSPVTHLDFRVWGTPASRGGVGRVILVLRTFPELVGRSVQNLVEIGLAVRTWKGDIGRYIRTISHFYIYRCLDYCVI